MNRAALSTTAIPLAAFAVPLLLAACTANLGGRPEDEGQTASGGKEEGQASALSPEETKLLESLGGADVIPAHKFRPGALRLSHEQWERATQALLHLDEASGISTSFTTDPSTRFDTSILERGVAATLRTDYERAAEELAARVANDRAMLMAVLPVGTPETPEGISSALTTEVARLAYRRPPTLDQVSALQGLFDSASTSADPVAQGSEMVLRALLQSPFFLYRFELDGTSSEHNLELNSWELASKLSFALWNSIPSPELLDAAANDALRDESTLMAWVDAMLLDARASDVLERLHTQLFRVNYVQNLAKNAALFPQFADDVAPALREQARLFFRDIAVEQDGGISEMLTSRIGYVNDLSAPLYGLTASGPDPVRVEFTEEGRAGYLTQIPYLAKNAGLSSTDPIHRGLFVVQELLCQDLPPPPNNVPPLPPPEPNQTTRELYDGHTGVGTCGGGCHVMINAPGYALEGFDAIGRTRAFDAGQPVDTGSTLPLPSGELSFADAVELMDQLTDSGELHTCYARRVAEYVVGREPADEELPFLVQVAAVSQESGSPREVLKELIKSPLFRNRFTLEEVQ